MVWAEVWGDFLKKAENDENKQLKPRDSALQVTFYWYKYSNQFRGIYESGSSVI